MLDSKFSLSKFIFNTYHNVLTAAQPITETSNNNAPVTAKYNLSWISDEYADIIISMLPLIVGFGVFYFLVIKPQNDKQEKEAIEKQAQIDSLSIGDTVILNCGIKGIVEKTGKQFVFISINSKTVIEVDKNYIENIKK